MWREAPGGARDSGERESENLVLKKGYANAQLEQRIGQPEDVFPP
jgi:hypothetical protein